MARLTGFSPLVREAIKRRAKANCERCGDVDNIAQHGSQIHHRRPRGMGGSRRSDTNEAANGLLLCGMCHRVVENNRKMALMLGWLVSQHRTPALIPLLHRGVWVMLADNGDIQQIPEPAGGRVA